MLINDMAKLNRSSRNSIFAALIVIATIAMYKSIITPHVNYLFAARQYDSAMSKAVEKNTAVAREIEVKTKRLKQLSEQFAESQDKLFSSEEAKEFFGDLQTILEETGCTVHSLSLAVNEPHKKNEWSKDASGIVANSAKLSISGGYSGIIGLVEGLQSHTPRVWVDSFRMELIDFNSGRLKCDMTITIYTIQDKEAII